MVKKILVFSVFVILIGAAIFQTAYIDAVFDELNQLADTVFVNVSDQEMDAAKDSIDALATRWEDYRPSLSSLIEHDEIDKICSELTSVSANINTENMQDLPASLARLRYYLRHIPTIEHLSLENVF